MQSMQDGMHLHKLKDPFMDFDKHVKSKAKEETSEVDKNAGLSADRRLRGNANSCSLALDQSDRTLNVRQTLRQEKRGAARRRPRLD
ncbi:MAG TPA: hypothetical protein VM532_15390 [Burkholderiales bacterium]|nr:hypothetical protein [Burkholderiales bacterium]